MYNMSQKSQKVIPRVRLDSNSPVPLHYQLSSAIIESLRQQRIAAETQLTSEANLARVLKLNRNTVRKAYGRLMDEKVLRRKPGERKIAVTPEFEASYRKESFPTIGLVLPDKLNTLVSNHAMSPLNYIAGVIDSAGDYGFATTIILLPDLDTSTEELREWFDGVRKKLCALVYIGDREGVSHDEAFELMLSQETIPQVAMGIESKYKHVARVVVDVRNGMISALNHLSDLNHRKIGLVFNNVPERKFLQLQSYSRYSDAMDAINSIGLETRPEWTVRDFADTESLRPQIIEMMRSPDHPSAILCHNDMLARSVIEILNSIGLDVPKNVSVVGYDDNQYAVSGTPGLTTIQHPRYRLGMDAVELIHKDYIGQKAIYGRSKKLSANLIVRESTGPKDINLTDF